MTNSTNARMFLWLGLAMALWLNYEAWQRMYAPPPAPVAVTAPTSGVAPSLADAVPSAAAPAAPVAAAPAPLGAAAPVASTAATLRVTTDVLDLDISLQGGTLVRADLLRYPRVKGEKAPVQLLNTGKTQFYALQTGLSDAGAGGARPTHLAVFSAPQTAYSLADGSDELRVPLAWSDPATGVTVTKTFVLRRGQYRIDLQYDIENRGTAPWAAAS